MINLNRLILLSTLALNVYITSHIQDAVAGGPKDTRAHTTSTPAKADGHASTSGSVDGSSIEWTTGDYKYLQTIFIHILIIFNKYSPSLGKRQSFFLFL